MLEPIYLSPKLSIELLCGPPKLITTGGNASGGTWLKLQSLRALFPQRP
jgi:hypothetical protein